MHRSRASIHLWKRNLQICLTTTSSAARRHGASQRPSGAPATARWYWGLPYRPLLPHKVYGLVINYIDHGRPHLFSRPPLRSPASNSSSPKIDGLLGFLPEEETSGTWWSVLDHCNGLLLCAITWESELCVCNPATQRWTVLPSRRVERRRRDYAGAYLVFDPAVSQHYEVILIPILPDAPSSSKDPCKVDEEKAHDDDDDDTCRLMEWPPSTWRMNVFSSRTGQWEDRTFVRKGEPAGVVQDMRLDPFKPYWSAPRQLYAVYWQGVLNVHCRGYFILRLVLSKGKYQVLKTPVNYIKGVKPFQGRVKKIKTPTTEMKGAKPYLGRLKNSVCYGIVYDNELRIWMLNESSGHTEWVMKYEIDIGLYADEVGSPLDKNGRKVYGSWMVEEDNRNEDDISEKHDKGIEWDSDNDDIFIPKVGDKVGYGGRPDILGFHPSKKVVFLANWSFKVAAYHFDSRKFQYLGYSRPRCYRRSFTNAIDESFAYTPCMVGDLFHGDITRQS
ncbi:hypothetical protein EJB05_57003, partial [Eragrostis curvula]